MSLVERFGILFDSNADDNTKENERLAKSFDKVQKAAEGATGATEADTSAQKKNTAGINKQALSLSSLARKFLIVAAAIKVTSSALKSIGATTQKGFGAGMLGLDVEVVERYAEAAARFGGNKGGTRSSIGNLVTGIEGLQYGDNSELFKNLDFLGANVFDDQGKKNTFEAIFSDIAKTAQTMDKAEFTNRAQVLGLNPELIRLMQSGNMGKELNTAEELGTTTKEQAARAAELSAEWSKIGQIWDTITREVADEFMPQMIEAAKWFLESSQAIRDGIEYWFGGEVQEQSQSAAEDAGILEKGRRGDMPGAEKAWQDMKDWFGGGMENVIGEDARGEAQKARDARGGRSLADEYRAKQAAAMGQGAAAAINQTSVNSGGNTTIRVERVEVDAGGNANSGEIAANIGTAIEDLAAVAAQYGSSGVLA